MKILGIKIDNLSRTEILAKIEGFLREDKFHQIATVNPEFILQAQNEADFRQTLNDADLCLADGVGIWFAFLRFGKYLKARFAGADLLDEILKIAHRNNYKIFLVADSGGLSAWEETRGAILQKYPSLEISGVNLDKKTASPSNVNCQMSIVFCSFGAPNQEKFLHSLKNQENAKIKLAIGVGGSFDYLTGKIKRAPKFMRILGLEWMWRLMQQPKRIKRIFNAVLIFPIKIIFNIG